MSSIQFGRFQPSGDVPEGRMLLTAGSITTTITSRATGAHITLRLRCTRRDPDASPRWPTVPFADATHVFVDDFDGEEIASYQPGGTLAFSRHATRAAQWTLTEALRYLAGMPSRIPSQAELFAMAHCLRCGRELTDPESIERGYGPDCWGERTPSRAERAVTP